MAEHPTLGEEIRRLRVGAGLTIADLASRSRIREAYLAAIESNREEPSAEALQRIACQLDPSGAAYDSLAALLTAPELDYFGDFEYDGRRRTTQPPTGVVSDRPKPTEPDAAAISALQFDRAEFDDSDQHTPCAMCNAPLIESYFDVNGRTVCNECCNRLRRQLDAGTSWSRAVRALAAGAAAAVAGTLIYFAILAATGYAFGLIAAVIGVMVGKAVKWGSYGRGGWKYQALAIALTYLSIGGSYVPLILNAIAQNQASAANAGVNSPANGRSAAGTQLSTGTRPIAPDTTSRNQPGILKAVGMAALVLLFLSTVAPFAGLNLIRLAITAIALYEAWKLNRRRVVVITGPHALGRDGISSATA